MLKQKLAIADQISALLHNKLDAAELSLEKLTEVCNNSRDILIAHTLCLF